MPHVRVLQSWQEQGQSLHYSSKIQQVGHNMRVDTSSRGSSLELLLPNFAVVVYKHAAIRSSAMVFTVLLSFTLIVLTSSMELT